MKTIDLFAGCGGMSLGFMQAGFEIVAAVDNWRPAITTYQQNFIHPIHELDLAEVDEAISLIKTYSPELIIGGPPCQDFSSAGKRDEGLGRANLTLDFVKIVLAIQPAWVIMENVERARLSKIHQQACSMLRDEAYSLTQVVLDASLCGVPQLRKRTFVIGHRHGSIADLANVLQQRLAKQSLTVRDYFGESLATDYYYRHPRTYERRAIFSIDEPSPTIRGVNRPIPKTYRMHPKDAGDVTLARPLTTKERSLIQTFPLDFKFVGTKSDQEQMIGNAVPVNLAFFLATSLQAYLNQASMQQLSLLPSFF
ncbi:DNA cytosine methyltransferase [Herpetosiphon llansteffanensis]